MSVPASHYERAREAERVGQLDTAEHLYARLGRPADAGRVAWKAGRYADAARHHADAGMPYEAALCLHRAGDLGNAMGWCLRVARDHAGYRRASQLALRIAWDGGPFDLAVDHWLGRYLASPPQDAQDVAAFELAARLYERERMTDEARAVSERVLAVQPRHAESLARVARLQHTQAHASIDVNLASQDVAFASQNVRRTAPRGALPDLPSLPPPSPARTALRAASGAQPVTVVDVRALPAGYVLAERYTVERKLGEGGMASVYAAHDGELDETVAVKVFQSDDAKLVARFKQEVALSRKLAHPHVIRLYDVGAQGNTRFLTMELLDGTSLDASLGRPLDVRTGIILLLHACAGLGAAHAAGIVHRDIKPANFFLTRAGVLKLMDFGIARRADASERLTTAGFIAGTPQYMAPEQVNNFSNATAAADLYALGCMAFEMFSGDLPFDHDELLPLLKMHAEAPIPSLRARNPQVPGALDDLVRALLAKRPAQRPASCEALASALRAVLDGTGR